MSMIECPHCGQMFDDPKQYRSGMHLDPIWSAIFSVPGKTVQEAAGEAGVAYKTAYYAGKRCGYCFVAAERGRPAEADWSTVFSVPGKTAIDAAVEVGLTPAAARAAGRRYGYTFARYPGTPTRKPEQEAYITRRLAEGATLTEVGAELDPPITRERVRQIANRIGVVSRRSNRASRERTAARNAARAEDRAREAAERKRIEDALREKVEAGQSIRQAAREIGLTKGELQTVSKRIGLGAITKHGRWRGRYRTEGDGDSASSQPR